MWQTGGTLLDDELSLSMFGPATTEDAGKVAESAMKGELSAADYVKLGIDGLQQVKEILQSVSGESSAKYRAQQELAKVQQAELAMYGSSQSSGLFGLSWTTVGLIGAVALGAILLVRSRS